MLNKTLYSRSSNGRHFVLLVCCVLITQCMTPVGALVCTYIPEIEYYGEPKSVLHILHLTSNHYILIVHLRDLRTIRTDFENVCPARLMTRRRGEQPRAAVISSSFTSIARASITLRASIYRWQDFQNIFQRHSGRNDETFLAAADPQTD